MRRGQQRQLQRRHLSHPPCRSQRMAAHREQAGLGGEITRRAHRQPFQLHIRTLRAEPNPNPSWLMLLWPRKTAPAALSAATAAASVVARPASMMGQPAVVARPATSIAADAIKGTPARAPRGLDVSAAPGSRLPLRADLTVCRTSSAVKSGVRHPLYFIALSYLPRTASSASVGLAPPRISRARSEADSSVARAMLAGLAEPSCQIRCG